MRLGATEIILIAAVILPLYITPTIICLSRKHPNRSIIILINILLGATFIGWIVALVWSLSSTGNQQIIVNNNLLDKIEDRKQGENSSYSIKLDQLERLKKLLDNGTISQEEFEQQKTNLLKD